MFWRKVNEAKRPLVDVSPFPGEGPGGLTAAVVSESDASLEHLCWIPVVSRRP